MWRAVHEVMGVAACTRTIFTCQKQAPDAEAVLRDHEHREHQQRVQLQVGAVDCLHADTSCIMDTDLVSLCPSARLRSLAEPAPLQPSSHCIHHHRALLTCDGGKTRAWAARVCVRVCASDRVK